MHLIDKFLEVELLCQRRHVFHFDRYWWFALQRDDSNLFYTPIYKGTFSLKSLLTVCFLMGLVFLYQTDRWKITQFVLICILLILSELNIFNMSKSWFYFLLCKVNVYKLSEMSVKVRADKISAWGCQHASK